MLIMVCQIHINAGTSRKFFIAFPFSGGSPPRSDLGRGVSVSINDVNMYIKYILTSILVIEIRRK